MLDIFNIPGQSDNIKIFYSQGTTIWQTWTRPRNCKYIWMMCIGGGGGGGNGSNLGGGVQGSNGGGSGGVVRALFPANVLPDTLFVQPGPGGAAAAAGNRSWVTIVANTTAQMNTVCVSGAAAATAGLSGAGGSGETIATTTNAGLLNLGNFIAIAGVNAPFFATVTPLANTITCPGGSGGSASDTPAIALGTSIVSTAISPTISGGTVGGINGADGITSWKPFYALGGAGGGGTNQPIPAGKGGDGGIGCGGGGGASSGVGGTAGAGGRGGDGLVIIATF